MLKYSATYFGHLKVLRGYLIVFFGAFLASFVFLYLNFTLVKALLIDNFQPYINGDIYYNSITRPFLLKISLCLKLSFIATIPIAIILTMLFVMPAIKDKNRKYFWIFSFLSVFFFTFGAMLAYKFVVHKAIIFLLSYSNDFGSGFHGNLGNTKEIIEIKSFVNFTLLIIFGFGVAMQIPLIMQLLIWMKVVNVKTIAKSRKYIFLLCFVIGAVLTPPDVVSQLIMAISIYLMFEVLMIINKGNGVRK